MLGKENKFPSGVYGYLATQLFFVAFLFLILYLINMSDFLLFFFLLSIAISGTLFIYISNRIQNYRFYLYEEEFVVDKGEGEQRVPFSKIDHIEISTNPLHKLFRICKLKIWSSYFPKEDNIRRKNKNPDLIIITKKNIAKYIKNFIFDKKSFQNYDYKYDR